MHPDVLSLLALIRSTAILESVTVKVTLTVRGTTVEGIVPSDSPLKALGQSVVETLEYAALAAERQAGDAAGTRSPTAEARKARWAADARSAAEVGSKHLDRTDRERLDHPDFLVLEHVSIDRSNKILAWWSVRVADIDGIYFAVEVQKRATQT